MITLKVMTYLYAGLITFNIANAQVIDSEKLTCQYKLTWIPDTNKRSVIKEDFMILRIGDKISDFYSYNTYRVDSAIQADKKKNISGERMLSKGVNYGRKGVTYHIIKNYPQGKITVTDKVATDDYKYQETIKQDWIILSDKLTIKGYSAQKAVCNFSGRRYIAWFTTEIPVASGPWKFSGLPGLIIKVEDSKGDFKFELIGIQQVKKDIPIQIAVKTYLTTTKENFQKLTAKFHKDPISYINQNTGMKISGSNVNQLRSLPYNPMEL